MNRKYFLRFHCYVRWVIQFYFPTLSATPLRGLVAPPSWASFSNILNVDSQATQSPFWDDTKTFRVRLVDGWWLDEPPGGPEGGPGPPPPSPPPPAPPLEPVFPRFPAPTSPPIGFPETFPVFTEAWPVPFFEVSFWVPFSPSWRTPFWNVKKSFSFSYHSYFLYKFLFT